MLQTIIRLRGKLINTKWFSVKYFIPLACHTARWPAGFAAAAGFRITCFHFRLRQDFPTTENMAANSDRNPPPFPAAEEPGTGQSDMADEDSDEGEDIFVSNVCLQAILVDSNSFVIMYLHRRNTSVGLPLIWLAVMASKITGREARNVGRYLKAMKFSLIPNRTAVVLNSQKFWLVPCILKMAVLLVVSAPTGAYFSFYLWKMFPCRCPVC